MFPSQPNSSLIPRSPTRTAASANNRRAFTLIELLIVIAIVGVLVGITVPVLGMMQKKKNQVACMSNLRQVMVATNLAAVDNNGSYPNMHGYVWEQGSTWIADALAPYVSAQVNQDPTKVLRCPAAQRNPQEAWLQGSQYCHYKYNIYYAQDRKPSVGSMNAMLFFDTTWPDWKPEQIAHSPGSGASVNVAYVDGHVASLSYADYHKLNVNSDESKNEFFKLGWIE